MSQATPGETVARLLRQRDEAREWADKFARTLDRDALPDFGDADGPWWACRGSRDDAPWLVSVWDDDLQRMRVVSEWPSEEEARAARDRVVASWSHPRVRAEIGVVVVRRDDRVTVERTADRRKRGGR